MKPDSVNYVEDGVAGLSLTNVSSLRDVRSAYMQAASLVHEDRFHDCVIALKEPALDKAVLANFFSDARDLLKPEIAHHIHIVVKKDGQLDTTGDWKWSDPKKLVEWFEQIMATWVDESKTSRPKGFSHHTVTMVLIRDWLLSVPARSMLDLQHTTGLSYPTVRDVIDSLEAWINRGAYKRIQLSDFPTEHWRRIVLDADRARETIYYHDPFGIARPTKALLSRLQYAAPSIAVGGTIGAQHYHRDLDLIGSPRLDLTLHQAYGDVDTTWMKEIDTSLERLDVKKSSLRPPQARVAIHVLRRKEALFEESSHGYRVADPAECLLDLVDLRLTDQAVAFANHFSRKISVDA